MVFETSELKQCFEIIREKLYHKSKYVLHDIVPVNNKLLGCLGQYFYLYGRKLDSKNNLQRHVTLFLKIVPLAGTRQRNFIQNSGVFNTEISVYTLLFPEMIKSFDKIVPKCILNLKDNFLILEDMTSRGFQMVDKFTPLDFEHCKIVLDTIGKFHGRSIIFENKNQENMLQFLQRKKVDLHSPDYLMQGAIQTDIKGVSSIIDLIKKNHNKKQWDNVKKKLKDEAKNYYKKIKVTEGKKVLCHGDLWSNNLLFKYGKNGKPVECCLVDFQLAR